MPATEPVKVGDTLIVEPNTFHRQPKEPVEVVVTKAARVWLEMTKVGEKPHHGNTWRMRRDTQDSGDTKFAQHNSHFFTPEQFAERQMDQVCTRILRAHWIEISHKSPHYGDKQFQRELADWLTAREARMKAVAEIQAGLV